MFKGRFCFSPAFWRDDNLIVKRVADFLTRREDLNSFLYLSIGEKENDKMKTGFIEMPSFTDTSTEAILNNINPNVQNTCIIYKHRTIIDKFVNLKSTQENYNLISQTLEKTKNDYFNLPEPKHD